MTFKEVEFYCTLGGTIVNHGSDRLYSLEMPKMRNIRPCKVYLKRNLPFRDLQAPKNNITILVLLIEHAKHEYTPIASARIPPFLSSSVSYEHAFKSGRNSDSHTFKLTWATIQATPMI